MRVNSKERPFVCEICNKAFSQSNKLKRHIRIHTKKNEICCKNISARDDLQSHTRVHTEKKPYVCEIYHNAYLQSAHLKTFK
ncbi:UNVERIFIED_CONTAM: zinc finger protein [Trichonephila clavipes]